MKLMNNSRVCHARCSLRYGTVRSGSIMVTPVVTSIVTYDVDDPLCTPATLKMPSLLSSSIVCVVEVGFSLHSIQMLLNCAVYVDRIDILPDIGFQLNVWITLCPLLFLSIYVLNFGLCIYI